MNGVIPKGSKNLGNKHSQTKKEPRYSAGLFGL